MQTLFTRSLAVLALTLSSAAAIASPVALTLDHGSFHYERTGIAKGGFADSYSFELGAAGPLSFSVLAGGKNADDVVIESVYLTQGATRIDLLAPPLLAGGYERWELAPRVLGAGNWTLHVEGHDLISKTAGAYQLNGSHSVPLPATLGLALVGLAGAAWTRRRA